MLSDEDSDEIPRGLVSRLFSGLAERRGSTAAGVYSTIQLGLSWL